MRGCPACGANESERSADMANFVARRTAERTYAALVPSRPCYDDAELLPPPRPPMRPPRNDGINPRTVFGNERTFEFYSSILEGGGFSNDTAKALIANEIRTTQGSLEPLMLDPVKGLDGPRSILMQISSDLGLDFVRHEITVSHETKRLEKVSGTGAITLRSLRAIARFLRATACQCMHQKMHQKLYAKSPTHSFPRPGTCLDELRKHIAFRQRSIPSRSTVKI